VRITVADDGVGVAPEHVPRLFEAFFTTKPPGEGSGLGLPVSYGIVRSHGGDLRYEPSAFGRGAAFTFDLPVHADPIEGNSAMTLGLSRTPRRSVTASGAARPRATRRSGGAGATGAAGAAGGPARARILVLDDEPSIRVFLDKALRSLGYEPVVVEFGDEAVQAATAGDFAAVLCDHQMAGFSGIDVFEAVARARPDTAARFVMMSGDVLNPTLEAFAVAQGVTLLAKPFDLETLDRTIRSVIEATGQPRG
jgi:CheY-like chemotaxis protein